MQINSLLYALSAGFIMDLVLGDPQNFRFHPVRLIGKSIIVCEPVFRKLSANQRRNGKLFLIIIAAFWTSVSWISVKLASFLHPLLGTCASAVLFYFTLSIKDLRVHVTSVHKKLSCRDIGSAREELARIVGRDTGIMQEPEIIRAAIETTAESTIDGIISPIFFACVGGAPLAWMYKTVNTLDSMVGYMDEIYKEFGYASARLDFILNIIPSLLSIIPAVPASAMIKGDWKNSFKVPLREVIMKGKLNSTILEAAFSGALNVKMGGEDYYRGKLRISPYIGKDFPAASVSDIPKSLDLSLVISILAISLGILSILFMG